MNVIPKKTVAMLVGLGVAHYVTHQPKQQSSTAADEEEEQSYRAFVNEEVNRREEKLALLVAKATTTSNTIDDVNELLESLEEVVTVLRATNNKQIWEDGDTQSNNVTRGYVLAARGIAGLLTKQQDSAKLRAVMDQPVHVIETQLADFRAPNKFRAKVQGEYKRELAKANTLVQEKRTVQLMKTGVVLRRALPEFPMIGISTILSVYSGTLDATRFYLRGEVLTRALSGSRGGTSRTKLVLQLLLLELLSIAMSALKERAQTIGKRKFVQNLKTDLFAALISQDISFFERNDLWEMRHLIGNADSVCTSLLSSPTNHLEAFTRIASSFLLLFKQSPQLASLLFFIALPIKHVATNWLEYASNQFELSGTSMLLQPRVADIWQTLVDAKALKTMRAFAREPTEIQDFSRAIKAKDARDERSALAYQLLSPCRDALDKLLDIWGVWYGGKLVGSRAMRATDLPAFVSLCSSTFLQLQFLQASLGTFGDDVLDPIEQMHDLLESKPEIGLSQPAYDANLKLSPSIEFRNVRFAYPSKPHAEILRGVSFSITAGERVGIMGESGCGKSTVFSLIERLYDPTAGSVLFGSKALKEINPLYLRERIAFVSQQTFMAKRTIKENLLYGRRSAAACTEQEITEALQMAQCSFFAEDKDKFPDGLLTDIGTNASKLSGGEVQRLSLARALLALPRPQVLLLDEYTSALDETSQAKIVDAVQALWEQSKITVVCIAHRLSNFKHVDRVIVLSRNGTVAEQGTPRDLLENPEGIFTSFVKTSQVNF